MLLTLIWVCLLLVDIEGGHVIMGIEQNYKINTDLRSSPFVVCKCAHFYSSVECGNYFPDWMVINNGFIETHDSNDTNFSIEIKDDLDSICEGSEDVRRCKEILHLNNVVVIGTGQHTRLKEILQSKTQTVFCRGSLAPSLKELILSNIKRVDFSLESIAERNTSLKIHLDHIENDLILPTGWYDYQYNVPDLDEDYEGSMLLDSNLTQPSLDISMFEVGNVAVHSKCVRMNSANLSISGAKQVTIESSAINEENSSFSVLSLRKVDEIEIKSSWGNFMLMEFVEKVSILREAISTSINSVIFKDILELTSHPTLSDLTRIEYIRVINVSSWIFPENTASSNDDIDMVWEQTTTENSVGTRDFLSKLIHIQDTNVILEGMKNIEVTAVKIAIQDSTFTCSEPTNTSLSFIGHEFELGNNTFPQWMNFCQVKFPVVCQNSTPFGKVCPVGFPYQFNEAIFEDAKCKKNYLHYKSDEIKETILRCFLGIGVIILCLLLIMALVLIRRHKKLSGNWQPRKMGSSYLPSSRQGFSPKGPQILHIPSNDAHMSFKFPRHFTGHAIPSNDDTLPAVNFYSYEDLRVLREQTQRNIERDLQKLAAVQLLNVKPYLQETQVNEGTAAEETLKELRRYSSSSQASKSSHSED